MGVSVTGASCVKGGVDGDNRKPALYVVGGATNSSSVQYPGLQRYSILDKKWESISPLTQVTQNRKHHGAAYLNTSSSLLVYGGSQEGDGNPSSQTFLVATYPPYGVQAFSSVAPPVVDPIMVSWSDSQAGMLGGSTTNAKVFTFAPKDGWTDVGVTLPNPLSDHTTTQCAVLSFDDGSKILETFDMGQSPNTVTRTLLLQAGGSPAPSGQGVGGSASSTTAWASSSLLKYRDGKRDTLLSTSPQYNGTLAPASKRSGFSLAQDGRGLVVLTGGNDVDPLCIFNQTANGWINATQLLQGKSQTVLSGGATATPTHTNPVSAPAPHSRAHTLTIIGIVLGTIFGLIALLVVALLFLKYLKKRGDRREFQRHNLHYPSDRKTTEDHMSFEDRDLQPLSIAAAPMGRDPVPSLDSIAIMKGGAWHQRQESSGVGSNLKLEIRRSSNVGFGPAMFARHKNRPSISRPILQEQGAELQERSGPAAVAIPLGRATPPITPSVTTIPPAFDSSTGVASRKTHEGWSTYFQGNNVVDLTKDRSPCTTPGTESAHRGTYWPDPSAPTDPRVLSSPNSRKLDELNHLSQHSVLPGSPDVASPLPEVKGAGSASLEGVRAEIANADTTSTTPSEDHDFDYGRIVAAHSRGASSATDMPHRSGIPSTVPEGLHWTPVGNTWSGPPQRPLRPPSSNTSFYPPPTEVEDSNLPSFPMPKTTNPPMRHEDESKGLGDTRPLHIKRAPPRPPRSPEPVRDYFGSNPDRLTTSIDMSWLNLGENRRPRDRAA